MKKILILTTCILLLLAAGCKSKQEEPTVEDLSGKMEAPAWANPQDYDYSTSMTAVIEVNLQADYPESAKEWIVMPDDRLAAFIGEECCGVADLQDGLFFLFITEPEGATDAQVSLRYYSAHFKNLFVAADVFAFRNDDQQGSVMEPYVPNFKVIKSN